MRSLKIWHHAAAAMFSSKIQLWPWLVASARASKRDIRYSAQRIQLNPLNGMDPVFNLDRIKTGDQSTVCEACIHESISDFLLTLSEGACQFVTPSLHQCLHDLLVGVCVHYVYSFMLCLHVYTCSSPNPKCCIDTLQLHPLHPNLTSVIMHIAPVFNFQRMHLYMVLMHPWKICSFNFVPV